MLYEGVQVYFSNIENLQDRIWLSEGIEQAFGQHSPDFSYHVDAVKPRQPWRPPTRKEWEVLVRADKPAKQNFFNHIAVLPLPEEIIHLLEKHKVYALSSKEDVLQFNQTESFLTTSSHLRRFIDTLRFSEEKNSCYFYFAEKPNLEVVTLGYQKERVGMHIDNRGRMDLSQADTGPNIILANLGQQDRYFIYINQTAANLKRIIELNGGSLKKGFSSEYIHKDFQTWLPDYPVVKLRIKPYEAYIAPAENIIHDGSTEGTTKPSVKFMAEGYYWL